MKRTIVILALVTAFVLAFTAVAQARWNGFTPLRTQVQVDDGYAQGFITFPEARAEMLRNFDAATGIFGEDDPGAALQASAHGGYVTTTTKCVVCHSAHRATGLGDPAGAGFGSAGDRVERNQNQAFLTAGATTCTACHVSTSPQVSRLLVEWGLPNGGPHAAPTRGCVMCHNAGIHGLSSSSFNVMNTFMLGNTRRGNNGGAPVAPGVGANNRDMLILQNLYEWTRPDSRDNTTMGVPAAVTFDASGNVLNPIDTLNAIRNAPVTTDQDLWWATGARGLGPIGTTPPALRDGTAAQQANPARGGTFYGAARSMATAVTCAEAGCHSRGAFFAQNWGVGQNVRAGIGAETDRAIVTGHVTPSVRATGSGTEACGPCHAGNPAGFPTASRADGVRDESRLAFGCDQCHDMVGVATNSTAWPHGNRNIEVYEWFDGVQEINTMTAGNLWMYAGNIARSADAPDINAQRVGGGGFQGPDVTDNPWFAVTDWFVMTNVTGGNATGYHATRGEGTGLIDGACLKCHVAIDRDSMRAIGSVAGDALAHTWGGHANSAPSAAGGTVTNPVWTGVNPTGSGRLFLYR